MNTDEFTHVNETSSRPGPIEINSDTPIIPEEVYKRHYGNYQENKEVKIDEEDLDDTPTSPDVNSTEVPPQEDNPSVGTSCPLIIPTRGKTKVQRVLKLHVWKFCYLNEEKTSSICNICKQHFKYTSGGSGETGGLKKHLINKHSKEWFAYINLLLISRRINQFKEFCNACKLPFRKVLKHVKTRWNSFYEMLEVAYTYKESITMQFNKEKLDLVTCQNSIKLLDKEMYDKYCSLDNVENPQMSMPRVGAHGRVKHKLAIGCGSDDGMELQDRQRALPRPEVDYGLSIAELEEGFMGLYNY
ncbi:hypothetical protein H5410_056060 [Solanum commersonii]|uniref:BED-type domain-containing protein n=1 Tax=Solanum commersonii TaxID=4109 RepID=A0A9J5WM11_SOLCO|nr:hypothetical protein H5410_056060 [Solanum commersonii]